MTTEELAQLGLSDKEAELYRACIELGPSKAKDIAAYTELNRGTVYDIARSLFKKGLLGTTQKRGLTYFVAHPPHQYAQELERELAHTQELLPVIAQLIQNRSYRPVVRFFEGIEGIKQVYEDSLNCEGKEILGFISVQETLEVVGPEFMRYYVKKRVRRHIKLRSLNDPAGELPSPDPSLSNATDPAELREARRSPHSIDVCGLCLIYDDTVALVSTKRENFGILLQSHEFSTMMRHLFAMIWAMGAPV